MSKKAKLSQLHKKLLGDPRAEAKCSRQKNKTFGANPERGQRGDFLKVTITLPPAMLADLKRLGIERKLKGQKDFDVSSLIRESLKIFLESQE